MENNVPVLFREKVHATRLFRTWLLMCLFVWVWGVCPLAYSIDPLRNLRQAALCVMFSSLWTIPCVLWVYSWKRYLLVEVRPDDIYIHDPFRLSGKAKHYRREDIQQFEQRRWPFESRFSYGWPFNNRLHLTNLHTTNIGVKLTLQNHRKVFIETRRPDEFIFAIDQMIRQEFRPPAPHPFDRYPPE
ncbi:MAG: hypothetical protein F9K46_15495 [Anaerolineae bacterium]|nr:MAG: hypothetical protein F9K46_15495 [Anaerolineae bacterium]